VLHRAALALGRAKEQGRGNVQVFDPALVERVHQRFRTREELRLAVEADEIEVHYQPLWRAAAEAGSCTLEGFEALVRWRHPVHGWMDPVDFVALAEETGLIGQLGHYVLRRACAQGATWRHLGRDVYVAVNLSARQARDPAIVGELRTVLAETGLDPAGLWVELPQTAIADGETTPERIDEIRALGVRVAIANCGVGQSSPARLRAYRVDALKLDRSTVADMTTESAPDGSGDDGAVVESVLALARKLGLSVVAEGVETDEQLTRLARLGVDRVQGFLLGRAVAPERTGLAGSGPGPA
jgi:EAL domain-containing protein (putative c-di-GMP-specific phosphodiesterase class I)